MTYLHVTSKCNMSCAHCIHDYGAWKRGTHMTWNMMLGAVNYAKEMDGGEFITLGGGEPTLNPDIMKLLDLLVFDGTFSYILMVTNGSQKTVMRQIIERYESSAWELPKHGGSIEVVMSDDEFHDPTKVAADVHTYFTNRKLIRNVGWNLINAGRAANMAGADAFENRCVCDNHVVYPDGRVTACGCPGSPVIARIIHQGYEVEWNAQDTLDNEDYKATRCAVRARTKQTA